MHNNEIEKLVNDCRACARKFEEAFRETGDPSFAYLATMATDRAVEYRKRLAELGGGK